MKHDFEVKDDCKYLVKFQKDYADEFDVYGITAMTSYELLDYIKEVNGIDNNNYPVEYGFGTNESLIYESSKDIFEALTVIEITVEQYEFLNAAGLIQFGHFPYFEGY